MFQIKNRTTLNLILIFSIFALSAAYFIQYILGHKPCNLCLIERLPYIFAIIIISLGLILKKFEKIITNTVPFYSQIKDISDPSWRGVSCGVASLAMLIDYYTNPVAPDILLAKGIAANAFDDNAGWSHAGLIKLAGEYGLTGETVWLGSDKQQALAALKAELDEGPVMASVHYTFDYNNPIPHLVVITEIDGEIVRYNDPAEEAGGGAVPLDKFASSWKNRYIKIRPSA